MEGCCYPERTIDPDVPPLRDGVIPDERGTVDHIVPLSAPKTPGAHVVQRAGGASTLQSGGVQSLEANDANPVANSRLSG